MCQYNYITVFVIVWHSYTDMSVITVITRICNHAIMLVCTLPGQVTSQYQLINNWPRRFTWPLLTLTFTLFYFFSFHCFSPTLWIPRNLIHILWALIFLGFAKKPLYVTWVSVPSDTFVCCVSQILKYVIALGLALVWNCSLKIELWGSIWTPPHDHDHIQATSGDQNSSVSIIRLRQEASISHVSVSSDTKSVLEYWRMPTVGQGSRDRTLAVGEL